jgi:hypothetical protein
MLGVRCLSFGNLNLILKTELPIVSIQSFFFWNFSFAFLLNFEVFLIEFSTTTDVLFIRRSKENTFYE